MTDTFYRERSGAKWLYWTYVDGRRHWLNAAWAERQIARKTAIIIDC